MVSLLHCYALPMAELSIMSLGLMSNAQGSKLSGLNCMYALIAAEPVSDTGSTGLNGSRRVFLTAVLNITKSFSAGYNDQTTCLSCSV